MPVTRERRSISILPDWLRKAIAVFAYNHGNYETAFRKLLPLAEHGNAEAQYYVGLMYSEGQGVPQDDAEAMNWCRKAATQGDANARFLVALQVPNKPDSVPTPEAAPPDSAPTDEILLEPAPTVLALAPPSEASSLDEGVVGYRFRAVLQLDTPMHVLEMHDRFVELDGELGDYPVGPVEPEAGPYGRHGRWQPVSNHHGDAEAALPSEVGPIKPSAYLPFLKAFRTIVESDLPADRQALQISALRQTWPEFWEQLSRNYVGLDERWFAMRLCALPGIGRNVAKALYSAGHLVADQVLALPDEALLAVRGIGKATLTKLRGAAPAAVH